MLNRIVPENVVQQAPRDSEFVANPYSAYAKWHSEGTSLYWKDYGFYCLLGYEQVNRALRDRRFARLPPAGVERKIIPAHLKKFAAAEEFSLLAMEPPEHTRLRKLVNRAFLSRQIGKMVPFIDSLANECIDTFNADNDVELIQQYATPIPLKVITNLLGVPESAGSQLVQWSHAMVRVYTLTQTHAEEIAANKAAGQFQLFLQDLIDHKRKHLKDDLLSHMLRASEGEHAMSDAEIISITILLLNAGHEATVHQIGNATFTLLKQYHGERRAELLEALCDDVRADQIVAECLRFAPPLHLFTRYAQEDLTLDGGVQIARGEEIGLLLAAANRCPEQFAQPNVFIPGRADAAHLSLGAGIHYCVGAHLSKLELRIALQVLFKRLPNLALASEPEYQDVFHFHGLQTLNVNY